MAIDIEENVLIPRSRLLSRMASPVIDRGLLFGYHFSVDNIRIINWYEYNETIIHPPAIILLILMIITILFIKKEYLFFPIIVILFIVPDIERVVVAGLDFDFIRIMVIFAIIRIFLRNEHKQLEFNLLDKLYLVLVICISIIYIINRKTSSAIIFRFGYLLSMVGFYLALRVSIRNISQLVVLFKCMILLSVILAIGMIVEQITKVNPFFIVGAEYDVPFREGRYRSTGSIAHPILAGTIGASLLPLIWAIYMYDRRNLPYSLIGLFTSLIITYTSASSGPLMTLGAGMVGIGMWLFRKNMKLVRRGVVVLLFLLQIFMRAPIWAILNRVSVVGGSTAYHRFALFDAFVNNFREWCLFGVESTAHWGWGLQDITNHYVRVGIDGGLISLVIFIVLIVYMYKTVGIIETKLEDGSSEKYFIWSLGVLLFAHNVSFIGVSYFGNSLYFYVIVIAGLAALANVYQISFKKEELPTLLTSSSVE